MRQPASLRFGPSVGRCSGRGPASLGRLVAACLLLAACAVEPRAEQPPPAAQPPAAQQSPAAQQPPTAQQPPAAGEAADLVRVIDGDSIEVDLAGETTEVRLIGYNAPELYGRAADGGADTVTCNGEAAKAGLAEFLSAGSLLVVGDDTDRYGRRLADVFSEGRSARIEMIEGGWGLATGDDPTGRQTMKRAAAQGLGLWGDGCGTPLDPGPAIGPAQVDPPGRDRDNLNDEWVTIVNRSPAPVDLDGWVIRDHTTGHRFELGGLLDGDGTVTIRSGEGADTPTDRHLNQSFPVWSNEGETVLLVDPTGVVAHWVFID